MISLISKKDASSTANKGFVFIQPILIGITLFLTGCNNITPNIETQTNKTPVYSEEMNDTLNLLEELSVKLEYGLNKSDYIENLAQIKINYNRITNESEKQLVEKVISTYDLAYNFWNECGSARFEYSCTGYQVKEIIGSDYPDIFSHEDDPSYTSDMGTARSGLSLNWNTNMVLSYLWNIASNETDKINNK